MKNYLKILLGLSISLLGVCNAEAADATGKVYAIEGHVNPACRRVVLTDANGAFHVFRIANPNGTLDSIYAALITALATQSNVYIYYDPAQTTGCGTEPMVIYTQVSAP